MLSYGQGSTQSLDVYASYGEGSTQSLDVYASYSQGSTQSLDVYAKLRSRFHTVTGWVC